MCVCVRVCLCAQLRKIPNTSPHYLRARMAMADIYLKHRKDKGHYIKCYMDLVVSHNTAHIAPHTSQTHITHTQKVSLRVTWWLSGHMVRFRHRANLCEMLCVCPCVCVCVHVCPCVCVCAAGAITGLRQLLHAGGSVFADTGACTCTRSGHACMCTQPEACMAPLYVGSSSSMQQLLM
jgi:hypothetical protein